MALLDPHANAAVRAAWNELWDSYSPPQVMIDAPVFLDPRSNASGTTVAAAAHTQGAERSWVSKVRAVFFGPAESALAAAYLSVEVDHGTAIVAIDGIPRGVTPLIVTVGAGHHTVGVTPSSSYSPPIAGVNVAVRDTARVSFQAIQGR